MENTVNDEKLIIKVIDFLEQSANKADPSITEPHLLMDDERFSEIEDFIPEPFGADGLRGIHDWMRKNGKPGDNVRFTKRQVYLLSPTTAYATSIQELNFDKPSKSRVTFVFLKIEGRWRVIHGHYSTMPKGE
jgi:hypothetical protein